jgi:hypothetical protein
VVLGAFNGSINHFILVVGYAGKGENISDFIVIDPHSELGLLGQTVRTGASSYNMFNSFMRYNDYFWIDERDRQDYFRTLSFVIEK